MAKLNLSGTFKRLRNRYRLVVMNEDTYEEVAVFKLNRLSVYIALCTLFVLLVGLTVSLLVFTPLKKLIPGYQQTYEVSDGLRQTKTTADSVNKAHRQQTKYLDNLRDRLKDLQPAVPLDTTRLVIKNAETDNQ
jgi:hypothetical protein